MIGLHILHSKGMIFMRNYMIYHVSILKRLLGFDFQGFKKRFKKGFSTFGRMRDTGNRPLKQGTLNTSCAL
jgi:hypothetical protein